MSILLKNGLVVDFASGFEEIADIYIEDDTIKDIGKDLNYDCLEVIDCTGLVVMPGMVDMHCHLREPGFEYKETIDSGVRSAAAGGFTSIACMPNTNPVLDNAVLIKNVIDKSRSLNIINVFPIGCITKGQSGQELAEIGDMKFAGAVAVSDDGKPVSNPSIMRKALLYSKMFDIPVISHCEELSLVDEGVMNEGYMATYLGLKGIPKEAEEIMVARDIILAENNNCSIHIAHISTKGSVEIIRSAKKRKVKVTAETCPHYFSLNESALKDYNTNAKVNPPLRTQEDVEAIIEGLADGTIDVVATDHAPHHIDDKNVEFNLAASGMVGFETALPLFITNLINTDKLNYKNLVDKMSYTPAKILGLNRGTIEKGKVADVTIFNPNEEINVDASKFKSKSKNSPFDGFKLKGKVYYTIVNGRIV